MTKRIAAILLAGLGLTPLLFTRAAEPLPAKIDFARDIRPILSENCFACHGPDKETRKAKLRLDLRDSALEPREGNPAITPGDLAKSELVSRISSKDPDEVMPPPKTGKKLTERQIGLLKQWIAEKAEYGGHWSFAAPVRPAVPAVKNSKWVRNPIDAFILARLDQENLRPATETSKEALIRRVTLDLTGLPPTIEEIDAFLADTSPDAYEKVVDRLLANPHYGERMALEWLDAARFADTHGFHIDSGRDMTRWREWVIDAFNKNMPFNQFTVEQFAGDLLPNPTQDQLVATGFHRNNMITFEGGAVPEEFLNAYVVDRVNTMSMVWLGLTVNCAQCHDHKYDPITQKDFYSLYAFFHNVPENPIDGSKGNAVPVIKTPTPDQNKKIQEMESRLASIQERINADNPAADAAQVEWEKAALSAQAITWQPLDPVELKSQGGATFARLADHVILVSGNNPATETYTFAADVNLPNITAIRVEALADESFIAKGPGRSNNGNIVMTEVSLSVSPAADPAAATKVKFKSASASFSQDTFPVANAIDGKQNTGWALYPQMGKDHYAIFETVPIPAGANRLTITFDFQSQFGQHQFGKFRVSATNSPTPHGAAKLPEAVRGILAIAPETRSDAQKIELKKYYRTSISPELAKFREELSAAKKELDAANAMVRTTMVMAEMPKPRDTFILMRGQYDKKGEPVTANIPASLPQLPQDAPRNRLGLARWLVDPANPLTARVIVNRYWQMYFGTGIVKTAEDFGSQGEWPSHPALLDWLATEFVSSGWDVKHIQRLIVTSSAYRQSSVVSKELATRDPENRLLARGPRLRLQAEFVRDQALFTSGLLNSEIGGKSVSPYQPSGLWEELMSRADGKNWTAQVYEQSHGPDLYRRTMYTFWKRTSPPPTLSTFDAPDRETCTVRRSRTNTPLQALILMNDPTYVEASRKLAERIMKHSASAEERIDFAFRLTTARKPRQAEVAVLKKLYTEQLAKYQKDSASAEKLLSQGESPRDASLDVAELAAWTMVSSTILNLDETITKG